MSCPLQHPVEHAVWGDGTAGGRVRQAFFIFKGASTTSPPTPCTALFQRFLNEGGTGLLSGIDLSATGSTPGPFALSFPYPFHKSFTEAPLPHWVHALFEIPGEGSHSRLHQRQRRQRDPDSKEKRRRFSQSSLLAGAPAFSIMECFEMMYFITAITPREWPSPHGQRHLCFRGRLSPAKHLCGAGRNGLLPPLIYKGDADFDSVPRYDFLQECHPVDP